MILRPIIWWRYCYHFGVAQWIQEHMLPKDLTCAEAETDRYPQGLAFSGSSGGSLVAGALGRNPSNHLERDLCHPMSRFPDILTRFYLVKIPKRDGEYEQTCRWSRLRRFWRRLGCSRCAEPEPHLLSRNSCNEFILLLDLLHCTRSLLMSMCLVGASSI